MLIYPKLVCLSIPRLFMVFMAFFSGILIDMAAAKDQEGPKKVLRYSEDGAPTTLDPTQSATIYSNLLVTSIYDTLYDYKYLKIPYELKPNLADGMPVSSADHLTYTIKIKKGVKFADDGCFPGGTGREVTAEDFVYSMKRHFDPKNRSQGEWLWRGRIVGLDDWKKAGSDYSKPVEGLKALDPYTVQLKLVKPFPQIIDTLTMGYTAVVPHEAVEKYGVELSVKPVGSGPFQLSSLSTQRAVLDRNPHFRQETLDLAHEGYSESEHGYTGIKALAGRKLPIVDRVEINFMKQAVARWNSFTKGSEIQYTTVPNEMVDQVLASKKPVTLQKEFDDKYVKRVQPEFGLVYSGFNMADDSFGYHKNPQTNADNKALRCAIRAGFNWRQRIDRFYFGVGDAYPGMIPPQLQSYSPLPDDSIKQDVALAKKLLKDHGWNAQNLPVFLYSDQSSVLSKQFFEQMRGFLMAIGYPRQKVKSKFFATFGDYNQAMKNAELPFISMGWGLDYPDAENTMQLFYGPNGSPGSNNFNYNNPKFNELYEQASVMEAGPERKAIFKQMNEILIDDCVVIAGFSRTRILLWHKNVVMYPSRSPHGNIFKYVDVL